MKDRNLWRDMMTNVLNGHVKHRWRFTLKYMCFTKKKKKNRGIFNCAIVTCLSSFLIWYLAIITLPKTYFSHSLSTLWSCLCSNSWLWIFSSRLSLDILHKTFFMISVSSIFVPLFSCTNLSSHWFLPLLVFDVLCEC